MKYIYIITLVLLCIVLCGCSNISLNKIQQTQLVQYIEYSNNIVQKQLSKDQNKRLRLQPYKTRYRLIEPIIEKIKSNQ